MAEKLKVAVVEGRHNYPELLQEFDLIYCGRCGEIDPEKLGHENAEECIAYLKQRIQELQTK